MAKYKSLFKVRGSLDDVNFYKTKKGYRMRTKGGVTREQILNGAAFERTRENISEFSLSASSGKLLRRTILDLVSNAKDSNLSARLTQTMIKVKNFDTTSARGQRKVEVGIQLPEGKAVLKGFNFNERSKLEEVLLKGYTLDSATGEVVLSNFIPSQHLLLPQGATHVEFTAGFANLDFATTEKELQLSNVVNLSVGPTASTITLTPVAVPVGTGQSLYVLKVAFFQEINGLQYPLKNGAFNALQLLEVL